MVVLGVRFLLKVGISENIKRKSCMDMNFLSNKIKMILVGLLDQKLWQKYPRWHMGNRTTCVHNIDLESSYGNVS